MRLLWSKTENDWVIELGESGVPDLHVESVSIHDSAGVEVGTVDIEDVAIPGTLSLAKVPVFNLHSADALRIITN